MKFFLGSIMTLAVVGAAVAFFLGSGRYNVAAVSPHWGITVWLLEETKNRSVSYHSRAIQPPPVKDPKLVQVGVGIFQGICHLCHGGSAQPLTEIAKGLNPRPPNLISSKVQMKSDAELFWIIKNGLKMTGMAAFGLTHEDGELWALVAFLRLLPDLKSGESSSRP